MFQIKNQGNTPLYYSRNYVNSVIMHATTYLIPILYFIETDLFEQDVKIKYNKISIQINVNTEFALRFHCIPFEAKIFVLCSIRGGG